MGSILYQVIGSVIISTIGVNMGILFAWPAFTLYLFQSQNTTLNRPMTDIEISLFSGVSSIGAIISTPTAGFLLDRMGRKNCSIFNSAGLAIVWVILTFSRRVEWVLVAIFLSGACSSVMLVSSVYLSEICQASIRGTMTGINTVSYGLGMLLSYLLGGYLEYEMMLYVGLSFSVAGACSLLLLKESPIHLLSKGLEKEAMESLAYFRRLKIDSKEMFDEINDMKRALNLDLDEDVTPEEEKLKPEMKPNNKLSFWKFVKKSQSSRRGFFITLVLLTAGVFQGLIVVQIYAEPLFRVVIPSASPTFCSVMLAIAMTITGFFAAMLTDIAGRRPLIIYASIGTGISCLVLGTQMQLHWGPNWITAVFMYIYPMIYTCGAGTVPFVLIAELFLPEVKSIFSMILMEFIWIYNFVILFIFKPLLNAVGWGPVFYIFAACSFLTAIYSFFFLPETKGLTVEEIQGHFTTKRKPSRVSA